MFKFSCSTPTYVLELLVADWVIIVWGRNFMVFIVCMTICEKNYEKAHPGMVITSLLYAIAIVLIWTFSRQIITVHTV